ASPRLHLCMIDAQNDFCSSGVDSGRRGSLYVENAEQEANLVAKMIDRLGSRISAIHASLDSHHYNDCSHNVRWRTAEGKTPDPFTIVSYEDVKNGLFQPACAMAEWNSAEIPAREWALQYTRGLETAGRMPLCLWPVHCLIGTWGHNLFELVAIALNRWCETTGNLIDFQMKGECAWTEHYSAIRADVVDPGRPDTSHNIAFLNELEKADQIAWVGWAGSHCLRFTALDAINHFGPGSNAIARKSIFFEDASAAVPDIPGSSVKFSDLRRQFLDEVVSRGALLTTTNAFHP
ncbi:MAG: hypothetical protein ACKO5E_12335, partial [bacterium]